MRFFNINLTVIFSASYFLVSGCFFFEDTTVSQAEIQKSSSWNEADQPPTFDFCDKTDTAAQWDCFEAEVTQNMQYYFETNPLVAAHSLMEEITLTLVVTKEGQIVLDEVALSNTLRDNIPALEDELYNAIDQLPRALPAIKTNVGETVDTQFQLPLLIQATPPAE